MTNEPIVVDFEGFADRRPVLAGVLVGRSFTQTAFTDVEPGIALAARGRRLECTEFPAFCAALIERARREQRAISGFSRHERTRIADGLGGAWPEDVEYIDAKKRAKAWRSARHPDAAANVGPERQRLRQKGERCGNLGNRLVDFVRLAGDEVPSGYDDGKGHRHTAARARTVGRPSALPRPHAGNPRRMVQGARAQPPGLRVGTNVHSPQIRCAAAR